MYERAVNSDGPVIKSYEIFLNGVLTSQGSPHDSMHESKAFCLDSFCSEEDEDMNDSGLALASIQTLLTDSLWVFSTPAGASICI